MLETTQKTMANTTDEEVRLVENTSCVDQTKGIKQLITLALVSNKRHKQDDRTSFRDTLDDAVDALVDIRVDDESKPKAVRTMMGKRKLGESTDNGGRVGNGYPRKNGRVSNGGGLKANTTCRSCGERNHWFKILSASTILCDA